MRPPERIDEILSLFKKTWKQSPDLRFMQLMYAMQSDYSERNNRVGRIEATEADGLLRVGYDLFHLEDDQFLDFLKNRLEENEERKG